MTNMIWVILLISFVLMILTFTLLRRKKIIRIILLLAIAGGAWYGYKEYTRTNRDLANTTADVSRSAATLVKEYEINDSLANKKYLGKIIETDGIIKEIKKDEAAFYTVVLGDSSSLSSVRCSMDTIHQQDAARLLVGSSVIIRGACTGFNKDEMGLGSDVILNRCIIVSTKK